MECQHVGKGSKVLLAPGREIVSVAVRRAQQIFGAPERDLGRRRRLKIGHGRGQTCWPVRPCCGGKCGRRRGQGECKEDGSAFHHFVSPIENAAALLANPELRKGSETSRSPGNGIAVI